MSQESISNQLFLHCKSKFNVDFNIFLLNEQSDNDGITAIVIKEFDTEIVFDTDANILRFPGQNIINAKPGDILSFHSSNKFTCNKKIDIYNFKYEKNNLYHGVGTRVFEVTATLKDEYKILVKANTYEDAIKQAYSIDLTEWKHVDLNTNLPSIQINRYTKWGMLDATEI